MRSRRSGTRQFLLALLCGALIVAACSGEDESAEPLSAQHPSHIAGWQALRACASGDNYFAAGGAYGLSEELWASTVGPRSADRPMGAPPHLQDIIANEIYLGRGAAAWPECGASLTGPMPVAFPTAWLNGREFTGPSQVFLNADTSAERIAEIEAELRALPALEGVVITFTDQAAALEEFNTLFGDQERLIGSVELHDMPTSFSFDRDFTEAERSTIRGWPGVFQVIGAVDVSARLRIPALDLNLVTSSWDPDLVDQDLHLMQERVWHSGRADWDLERLSVGDRVHVQPIAAEDIIEYTVSRVLNVAADEIATDLDTFGRLTILLIGVDPDDPGRRILVVATR